MLKILLFLLMVATTATAQFTSYSWVKNVGGSNQESGNGIVVDAEGNTYTIGNFQGVVDFDPGPAAAVLTSNGVYDAFLLKLDSLGNFLWVKQLGGAGNDLGAAIALDDAGSVYVTGNFVDTIFIGAGAGAVLLSAGIDDAGTMFLGKFDTNGNVLWVKRIGGNGNYSNNAVYVATLTLDAAGSIYTSGSFTDTVDFDPSPTGVNNLISSGSASAFISKLSTDGTFLWVKQIQGSGIFETVGRSIGLDQQENICLTGTFCGDADFDPGPGVSNLFSSGGPFSTGDIFVLKLDNSGNYIWAKQVAVNGNNNSVSSGISSGAGSSIYIAGNFAGTVDFDPGTGISNLSIFGNAGLYKPDIFVLKLDASGNFAWVRQLGGPGNDYCKAIVLDGDDNITLTGSYDDWGDFDPGPVTSGLNPNGRNNIYLAQLDTGGNYNWAKQFAGTGYYCQGNALAVNANNDIYTTGLFSDTVDFDPGAGVVSLLASGYNNVFIHKMASCNDTSSAQFILEACDSLALGDVTYYATGIYTQLLTNNHGCDSLLYLDLTIHNSLDTFNVTTCNDTFLLQGNTYTASGFYPITASPFGCHANILHLTINSFDAAITLHNGTLTANVANAAGYQWIDCDNGNMPIIYAVDQNLTPIVSGSYAVIITNNGCADTSDCISMTPTGIADTEDRLGMKLYPNPSDGNFILTSDKAMKQVKLKIVDVLGRTIWKREVVDATRCSVDISDVPSGLYYLDLEDKGKHVRFKVIKK